MKQKSTLYRSVEFGLAVAIAVFGGSARAHDTWIAAKSPPFGASQTIEMQMTSGERYPHPGSPIAPERVDKASCMQAGKSVQLLVGQRDKDVLHLSAEAHDDSGMACWVRLKPRSLELSEAKVKEYLDEIDAPKTVRDAWNKAQRPRKWSEVYTKNAKIVMTGMNRDKPFATDVPVGLKLELLVMNKPETGADAKPARRREDVSARVLLDGQPKAGVSIVLTPEKGGRPQRQRSDADGYAVFRNLSSGRWMLSTTDLVAADASGSNWQSQFSTLVFERD